MTVQINLRPPQPRALHKGGNHGVATAWRAHCTVTVTASRVTYSAHDFFGAIPYLCVVGSLGTSQPARAGGVWGARPRATAT